MQATLQRSGSAWYRQRVCHFHCTVLAAHCGADVWLCLFLALNVVYLSIYAKLGLVFDMTKQMSNGKEVDIVNCQPSKIMSTSFRSVDMIFLGLTIHCLPPYHLTL